MLFKCSIAFDMGTMKIGHRILLLSLPLILQSAIPYPALIFHDHATVDYLSLTTCTYLSLPILTYPYLSISPETIWIRSHTYTNSLSPTHTHLRTHSTHDTYHIKRETDYFVVRSFSSFTFFFFYVERQLSKMNKRKGFCVL